MLTLHSNMTNGTNKAKRQKLDSNPEQCMPELKINLKQYCLRPRSIATDTIENKSTIQAETEKFSLTDESEDVKSDSSESILDATYRCKENSQTMKSLSKQISKNPSVTHLNYGNLGNVMKKCSNFYKTKIISGSATCIQSEYLLNCFEDAITITNTQIINKHGHLYVHDKSNLKQYLKKLKKSNSLKFVIVDCDDCARRNQVITMLKKGEYDFIINSAMANSETYFLPTKKFLVGKTLFATIVQNNNGNFTELSKQYILSNHKKYFMGFHIDEFKRILTNYPCVKEFIFHLFFGADLTKNIQQILRRANKTHLSGMPLNHDFHHELSTMSLTNNQKLLTIILLYKMGVIENMNFSSVYVENSCKMILKNSYVNMEVMYSNLNLTDKYWEALHHPNLETYTNLTKAMQEHLNLFEFKKNAWNEATLVLFVTQALTYSLVATSLEVKCVKNKQIRCDVICVYKDKKNMIAIFEFKRDKSSAFEALSQAKKYYSKEKKELNKTYSLVGINFYREDDETVQLHLQAEVVKFCERKRNKPAEIINIKIDSKNC